MRFAKRVHQCVCVFAVFTSDPHCSYGGYGKPSPPCRYTPVRSHFKVCIIKIYIQRTLVITTLFVTKGFAVKSNLLL